MSRISVHFFFLVALLISTIFIGSTTSFAPKNSFAADPNYYGTNLGTLLVFPKFDIRNPSSTEIRVVNQSDDEIQFYYNYVCPGIPFVNPFCAKLDRTISLTPHQTTVLDVSSQHPPCNQGFVIGYPINSARQPISYNFLRGSYKVTTGRSFEENNAIAFPSVRSTNTVLGSSAGFEFNPGPNQDFVAPANVLLTDFKASLSGINAPASTRIILMDISSALGRQNPISNVIVDFWNSSEVPFSSSLQFICWTELNLESIDNNFLAENLGTNFGSLRAEAIEACPVPGACPPYLPRAPLLIGAIQEHGDEGDGASTKELLSYPPTPTPTPTSTPTPTPTPTPTDTPTPTPTTTNTPTPTNTPSPTDTPTPTNTPAPSNTPTPTNTPGPLI